MSCVLFSDSKRRVDLKSIGHWPSGIKEGLKLYLNANSTTMIARKYFCRITSSFFVFKLSFYRLLISRTLGQLVCV